MGMLVSTTTQVSRYAHSLASRPYQRDLALHVLVNGNLLHVAFAREPFAFYADILLSRHDVLLLGMCCTVTDVSDLYLLMQASKTLMLFPTVGGSV